MDQTMNILGHYWVPGKQFILGKVVIHKIFKIFSLPICFLKMIITALLLSRALRSLWHDLWTKLMKKMKTMFWRRPETRWKQMKMTTSLLLLIFPFFKIQATLNSGNQRVWAKTKYLIINQPRLVQEKDQGKNEGPSVATKSLKKHFYGPFPWGRYYILKAKWWQCERKLRPNSQDWAAPPSVTPPFLEPVNCIETPQKSQLHTKTQTVNLTQTSTQLYRKVNCIKTSETETSASQKSQLNKNIRNSGLYTAENNQLQRRVKSLVQKWSRFLFGQWKCNI